MSTATAEKLFADPKMYLSRRYRVEWRVDAIAEIVGARAFRRVLDLGCGDGSLTLPRLREAETLTLVDMSAGMLEEARAKIPQDQLEKVEIVCGDVASFDRPEASYDLVVCVGLLAHVDDPRATVARAVELLAPGGTLILEIMDASHPLGWLLFKASLLRSQLSGAHRWNEVRERSVLDQCRALGLSMTCRYSYGLPVRFDRVLSDRAVYKLGRALFGPAERNTNAWLGCERLYAFQKPASASA